MTAETKSNSSREIDIELQKLRKLTDDELEAKALVAVRAENESVMQVIYILSEIERRRLYSKKSPSLHEYCKTVLKYDGGRAQRRIDTMRAMRIIPEIKDKVLTGKLSMTVVSQTQSFLRAEEKSGKNYTVEAKKELFEKLENKSSRECKQALVEISPKSVPEDRRRPLTSEKSELRTVVETALLSKLDRIKNLLSHKNPNMTDSELIAFMAELSLDKLDPERKNARVEKKKSIPAPEDIVEKPEGLKDLEGLKEIPIGPSTFANNISMRSSDEQKKTFVRSRYIPALVKRQVWLRDGGQCTFQNCNSKRYLEYDHIKPWAMGGDSTSENLRLRCRAHNAREAINIFGFDKMRSYMTGKAL